MPWLVTNFEREKLYEEVWSEPMVALAKRYQISDVGLRKICKRLGVPLPSVGHWARVQAGNAVDRPPLPKHKGETEYCSRRLVEDQPSQAEPEPAEVIQQKAYEALPEHHICVADSLEGAHRFVRVTEKGFRKAFVDYNNIITWPRGDCVLDIAVSLEYQQRALLLMDALLKGLITRGHKVYAELLQRQGYQDRKYIYIEVLGERLALRLSEKTRREDRPLTQEELQKKRHERDFRPEHPWIYFPTGLFTLTILGEDRYDRRKISDRKSGKRLEDDLNGLIVAIVEEAVRQRRQRQVAQENKLRIQQEIKEHWERQRLRDAQLERLKRIEKEASEWERAERLRTFAKAYEARAVECGHDLTQASDISELIAWMRDKADWLDPMIKAPWPEVDNV
jgi:hypothetical protein